MNEEKNVTFENIKDAFVQMFSLCHKCKHKEVCKCVQEKIFQLEPCDHFLSAEDYKIYGSVYSLFQPVFDWLSYHHPHDDVKFVVNNHGAKMYLEHGVFVPSEQLKKNSTPLFIKDKMQDNSGKNKKG